jgi:hypothetical protein
MPQLPHVRYPLSPSASSSQQTQKHVPLISRRPPQPLFLLLVEEWDGLHRRRRADREFGGDRVDVRAVVATAVSRARLMLMLMLMGLVRGGLGILAELMSGCVIVSSVIGNRGGVGR